MALNFSFINACDKGLRMALVSENALCLGRWWIAPFALQRIPPHRLESTFPMERALVVSIHQQSLPLVEGKNSRAGNFMPVHKVNLSKLPSANYAKLPLSPNLESNN